jgi:formylglycine-generating enzyme required for sulfatase activity
MDEHLAHDRIQDTFRRFDEIINKYSGRVLESRGDAILAEFERPSDAVTATLAFQVKQSDYLSTLVDNLKPEVRVGIAMGEVVIADNTITGAGVVLAQRVEQLANPSDLCITAAIHEALSKRFPFEFNDLGEQNLKGFDHPLRVYRVSLSTGSEIPAADQTRPSSRARTSRRVIATVTTLALIIAAGLTLWIKPWQAREQTASADGITPSLEEGFQDCSQCPIMLVVPSGTFLMGYDKGDPDEKPVHEVKVNYDLAVSKYEVTFEEWDYCVSDGGCNNYLPGDKGWGRGKQPVIFVSWLDAQSYVMWLRDKTGQNYRLLTEAEWEYAARGGSTMLYPWGVTYDGSKANYGNLKKRTVPVGSYESNGYGLYDVIGNVWEWVIDCYDKRSYSTHESYPAAFLETSETCKRVVRGGSWNVDLSDGYDLLRTSIRWRGRSNGRYHHFGIRVARDM